MTRWFTSELVEGYPLFALLYQGKWDGFPKFNLDAFALCKSLERVAKRLEFEAKSIEFDAKGQLAQLLPQK